MARVVERQCTGRPVRSYHWPMHWSMYTAGPSTAAHTLPPMYSPCTTAHTLTPIHTRPSTGASNATDTILHLNHCRSARRRTYFIAARLLITAADAPRTKASAWSARPLKCLSECISPLSLTGGYYAVEFTHVLAMAEMGTMFSERHHLFCN